MSHPRCIRIQDTTDDRGLFHQEHDLSEDVVDKSDPD